MSFDAGRVEVGVGFKLDQASKKKVDAAVREYSRQKAEAKLGFTLDRKQLDRGYQLLRKWRTERADARLGFRILRGEFNRHEQMLKRVRGKEAKAKLGFKIDRGGMASFERQIRQAAERAGATVKVRVEAEGVDSASSDVGKLGDESERTTQRMGMLERAAKGTVGGISQSAGAMGKMTLSMGPLSGRLTNLSQGLAVIAPLVVSLAGFVTGLGASFASAAGGAGALGAGLLGALAPAATLGIALFSRFGAVMDAFDARQKAADASAINVGQSAQKQATEQRRVADTADQVANAQESVADANEAVADAQDSVTDASKQVTRAQRDYKHAVEEAREELQEAAQAEQAAAEDVVLAQRSVAEARRDAARAAQEANQAVRQGSLDVKDAEFALTDAQDAQGEALKRLHDARSVAPSDEKSAAEVAEDVKDASHEYQKAQHGVRQAEENLREARRRSNEAQQTQLRFLHEGTRAYGPLVEAVGQLRAAEKELSDARRERAELEGQGIRRNPQVIRAAESVTDAQQGLREAHEGVARALRNVERAERGVGRARRAAATASGAAGLEDVPAQVRRAELATQKLTKSEREFLGVIEKVKDTFEKGMRPATDRVFQGMSSGINKLIPSFAQLEDEFTDFGAEVGKAFDGLGEFFAQPRWVSFMESMTDLATQLVRPLFRAGEGAARIAAALAEAAKPALIKAFGAVADTLNDWADALERDPEGLQKAINTMVDDLGSWVEMIGAAISLAAEFLGVARGEGKTWVEQLTDQFRKWEKQLEDSEDSRESVREWLRDSKDAVEDLAHFLGPLISGFVKFGRAAQDAVENLGELLGFDGREFQKKVFGMLGFLSAGFLFARMLPGGDAIGRALLSGSGKALRKGAAGIKRLVTRMFTGGAASSAASSAGGEAAGGFISAAGARLRRLTGRIRTALRRIFVRTGAQNAAAGSATEAASGFITSAGRGIARGTKRVRDALKRIFRRNVATTAGAEAGGAAAGSTVGGMTTGFDKEGKKGSKSRKSMAKFGKMLGGVMAIAFVVAFKDEIVEGLGDLNDWWNETFHGEPKGTGDARRKGKPHYDSKATDKVKEALRNPGGAHGGIVTPYGIVRGFAAGGIAGLDPRDTVPAMLRPGEGILTPEATAAVGGARGIAALNNPAAGKGMTPGGDLEDQARKVGGPSKKVQREFKSLADSAVKEGRRLRTGLSDSFERARKDTTRSTERIRRNADDRFKDVRESAQKHSRRMRVVVDREFDNTLKDTTRSSKLMFNRVDDRFRDMERNARRLSSRLADRVGDNFSTARRVTDRHTARMERTVRKRMDDMQKIGQRQSNRFANNVGSGMGSADSAVYTGLEYIGRATRSALGAFEDAPKLRYRVPRPKGIPRRERGGYIGEPGERAPDEELAWLGRGEAVLTGWDQGPVDVGLGLAKAMGLPVPGSLDEMFNDPGRRVHSTAPRFAKGGYVQGAQTPRGDAGKYIRAFARKMFSKGFSATSGGEYRGSGTNHDQQQAIDWGDSVNDIARFWRTVLPQRNHFEELLGPSHYKPAPSFFHGAQGAFVSGHNDHIHTAVDKAIPNLTGGDLLDEVPKITVQGPKGPLKWQAQAAINLARKGANKHIDLQEPEGAGGIGNVKVSKNAPQWVKDHKGNWNANDCARLFIAAGGPRNMAALMGRIAQCESVGGNPRAVSYADARGLWQIHWPAHASWASKVGDPFDPWANAKMAINILKSQGLGAWDCYTGAGSGIRIREKGGKVDGRSVAVPRRSFDEMSRLKKRNVGTMVGKPGGQRLVTGQPGAAALPHAGRAYKRGRKPRYGPGNKKFEGSVTRLLGGLERTDPVIPAGILDLEKVEGKMPKVPRNKTLTQIREWVGGRKKRAEGTYKGLEGRITKLGEDYTRKEAAFQVYEEDIVRTPEDPGYSEEDSKAFWRGRPGGWTAGKPYIDQDDLARAVREQRALLRIKAKQLAYYQRWINGISSIIQTYRAGREWVGRALRRKDNRRLKGKQRKKFQEVYERWGKEIGRLTGRLTETRGSRADVYTEAATLGKELAGLSGTAQSELDQLIEQPSETDTSGSDTSADTEAQLARTTEALGFANTARGWQEAAFNVFAGPGDIGRGARTALRAGAGIEEGYAPPLHGHARMDQSGQVSGGWGQDLGFNDASGQGLPAGVYLTRISDVAGGRELAQAANRGNGSMGHRSTSRIKSAL